MKQYNPGEFNYFDDSGGFCCSGEPGDYGKSVDFGYWYLCWFGESADSKESTDSGESDGFGDSAEFADSEQSLDSQQASEILIQNQ